MIGRVYYEHNKELHGFIGFFGSLILNLKYGYR